ncbi:MAG: hypothetical protein HAW63_02545 [Bdellovibrionaceae bacterium]|nr:hypothetical protein [Pseudobdellovibrionaceae bacterium]
MKILSALLVFSFLFFNIAFAKRRRVSHFQRKHTIILNTQNLFNYYNLEDSEKSSAKINLSYAYNSGNFEVQPYLETDLVQANKKFKINTMLLGLNLHFNFIENRRGKRWVPYALLGANYVRTAERLNLFGAETGAGFKYFLTSRLAMNPEVVYRRTFVKKPALPDWKIITNINFRYYF